LGSACEARRPQALLQVDDLDAMRKMAERRRHLEALLKRTQGDEMWAAQIREIVDGLPANDGAELLSQLADSYRTAGRLDLAADTHYLLARRFPDHPLASRALEWLIQFYASSEAALPLNTNGLPLRELGRQTAQAADVSDPAPAVQQTSAVMPASSPAVGLSRNDRLQRALQLAEYLRASHPNLYEQPRVRLAEAAAQRQLGFDNLAKRYFFALRRLPETNSWRRCGEAELWLAKPGDLPPPKAIAACRPAAERPHLDAQLIEPCWETEGLRLGTHQDESTKSHLAEVRLAYDKEYLYLAFRCPKTPGGDYKTSGQPRPRDADLSKNDRLTLRFDIDRDFTTAFELTVDSRGWTHDRCWGNDHWNPAWYVAAASDDQSWTVEAALPLAELVVTPPDPRHAWAVSATRTIPRTGYQTWTGDPAADSPNQFGILLFE
jgi:hypothetical protein